MNILQINTVYPIGSTGKIALHIHDACMKKGFNCITAHRYAEDEPIKDSMTISSWIDCHIHNRLSKYTGLQGCFSNFKTLKFLKNIDKIKPDIIHIHNLHGSYINSKLLFNYIKKNNIRVVWTLHDCWSFTGHCVHFTGFECYKWKTQCFECPTMRSFFNIFFDSVKHMHNSKKRMFLGVENMTLVVPSVWLYNQVNESFLKKYPIKIINNGIDLSIFRPTEGDFRVRYDIANSRYMILGVAFGFSNKKGLDVFADLAKRLDGDKYQIVLVGIDANTYKKIPNNIICIPRLNDQRQLAQIYTAADLFVNPTREDTYPTVNMESLACGTPVLTFKTGGSVEIIDETCGSIVNCDDVDALEQEIIRICSDKPYMTKDCLKKATEFNNHERINKYINLYEDST